MLKYLPAIEEDILTSDDIYAINSLQEAPTLEPVSELPTEQITDAPAEEDYFADISDEDIEEFGADENSFDEILQQNEQQEEEVVQQETEVEPETEPEVETEPEEETNPQIENILEDDEIEEVNVPEPSPAEDETAQAETEDDDDLSFMDDFHSEETAEENPTEAEVFPDDEEVSEQAFPEESETSEQLTEDDLDFIENSQSEDVQTQENAEEFSDEDFGQDEEEKPPVVPVYDTDESEEAIAENIGYKAGDKITHPRYGNGTVEKIIKYGNKTLCSIDFENVGRRLLDPSISDFEKVE